MPSKADRILEFCLRPIGLHPLHWARVLRDERICSQQRNALGPRLSNQDTVERILVHWRQTVDRYRVCTVDHQFAVSVVH